MKRAILLVILTYYSLGSLVLPLADFSIIPKLPELYTHCKTTEDEDMNLVDFITDHLMNIDGMFDKHEDEDEQKPHSPFNHTVNYVTAFLEFNQIFEITLPKENTKELIFTTNKLYHYDFVGTVFRPPIS